MTEALWLLVAATFLVTGLGSAEQAIKNSVTSSDRDTGLWFFVGLLFMGLGIGIGAIILL